MYFDNKATALDKYSKGSKVRQFMYALLMLMLPIGTTVAAPLDKDKVDLDHQDVFSEEMYPSANKCAACHQKIYDQWSVSSHAYSAISPMFHKFEQAINNLAPTISHFCVSCHISVGTAMGETRDMNLWERSQVSREGVTCITCHRVQTNYGKVNGFRRIVPGNINQPVYGNTDAKPLDQVIEQKDYYKVSTKKGEKGKPIHTDAQQFTQLSEPEFCVSCHQVAVNLGIKLEVVWDQYRDSPAHAEGITCQECHMGIVPGVPSGFEKAPVAIVKGEPIDPDRDHHNHSFYGPGYSIAHPGIFPHNPDALQWSVKDWLEFDYRAGWGTEAFEAQVDAGKINPEFPEMWSDPADREDARAIVEVNLDKLRKKARLRKEVMENGTQLDGPYFEDDPEVGEDLEFTFKVSNVMKGHNIPSGSLGAQPELWLNVVLQDPDGKSIWESGYVDSNGDMADLHSLDVRAGKLKHDDQLFNLQTKFLTTNIKGTDREMYLPVQFDQDQLPFLRPPQQPVSVMNHPPFVRMEGRSLPPLSSRDAEYSVPGDLLKKPGTYKISARMRSRAEPIYFMRFVQATPEMEKSMNEWMIDLHAYSVEFEVKR